MLQEQQLYLSNALYFICERHQKKLSAQFRTSENPDNQRSNFSIIDIPIAEIAREIQIEGEIYIVEELHLTIYKGYKLGHDLFSPFHGTMTCSRKIQDKNESSKFETEMFKVRCYSDLSFNLLKTTFKYYNSNRLIDIPQKSKSILRDFLSSKMSNMGWVLEGCLFSTQEEIDEQLKAEISALTEKNNSKLKDKEKLKEKLEAGTNILQWIKKQQKYFYDENFLGEYSGAVQNYIADIKSSIEDNDEKIVSSNNSNKKNDRISTKKQEKENKKQIAGLEEQLKNLKSEKNACKKCCAEYRLLKKILPLIPGDDLTQFLELQKRIRAAHIDIFYFFQVACSKGNLEDLKILTPTLKELKKQFSIELNGRYCRGVIIAIQEGQNKVIEYLANELSDDLNWRDPFSAAPLTIVAYVKKNFALLKWLIENGKVSVSATTVVGEFLLAEAAYQGNKDIVAYLITKGANLDQREEFGKSAFFGYTAFGEKEIARINSAQEMMRNKTVIGGTALLFTMEAGHYDIATMLLKAGANPNILNSNNLSPLALAIGKYLEQRILRLQRKQVDSTSLLELIDLLLEKGADVKNPIILLGIKQQEAVIPIVTAIYEMLDDPILIMLFRKHLLEEDESKKQAAEAFNNLLNNERKENEIFSDDKLVLAMLNQVLGDSFRKKYLDTKLIKWQLILEEDKTRSAILVTEKSAFNKGQQKWFKEQLIKEAFFAKASEKIQFTDCGNNQFQLKLLTVDQWVASTTLDKRREYDEEHDQRKKGMVTVKSGFKK